MNLYLDFFEAPEEAVRRVQKTVPLGAGLAAFIVGGLSLLAAQGVFRPLPGPMWLPWAIALWAGWRLLAGLSVAALTHFVAESWGGDGRSAVATFILFGFSELVWALLLPIGLLARVAGGGLPGWLAVAAALAALSFALRVRAIRHHYGFPPSKAAAALFLPYAALALGSLLAFVAWASGFAALLAIWLE